MEKTGTLVGVGHATSYLLAKSAWFMKRPLVAAGTVAGVLFLAEQGWLAYEFHGFRNAFASPAFYVRSGGNLGAIALGSIGAVGGAELGLGIGVWFGPYGPLRRRRRLPGTWLA